MIEPASFFPDTAAGWTSLVVQWVVAVSTAVGVTIRFVRQPLEVAMKNERDRIDEKFKSQGERLGAVETASTRNSARLEDEFRERERLSFEVARNFELFTRTDEHIQQLAELVRSYHETRLADAARTGERLARLESLARLPPP